MVLGDLGAEVIKIENPNTGDDTRTWGPPFTDSGEAAYFLAINRNKKSVAINFRSPDGRKIVEELVAHADVVIENFLPNKLESLGLGYEALKAINPRLIYASLSSYGATGPSSHMPGYDVMVSARGGLMGITGDTQPAKVGVAITDITAGLFLHGAIMAALISRERTGQGQKIDTSLLEVQVAALANIGQNYLLTGLEGKRWGTAHPSIVPYQSFQTKDGFLAAGALNNRQFALLCEKLELPSLCQDAKFATNAKRVENRQELIALLAKVFKQDSTQNWLKKLEMLPCSPVNGMADVFSDPQVLHRNMVMDMEHPIDGRTRTIGFPVKYSETPCKMRSAPPLLGQHTSEVLRSLLSKSESQLKELHQTGVLRCRELVV
eukprot:CAMPEP_0175166512 /NCGR_PEP_ID=MMETSP0087-20121206/27750_1 /TAXON_ID=136419 /ORGANISM="Unknown Unknown, Strain D1" /LENGTH=377 /DNA_ID=CAMNT_0016456143 /DNA_START=90 /DNA_END=1223 /DNA_ORIENTATION=-